MKNLDFDEMRQAMVRDQLITRGISDSRVLSAFSKVPRHKFISDEYFEASYSDYPLPIAANQTISQPYMVALMTERLGVKEGDRILEVGTGSGYQMAILAELAREVYSVERAEELAHNSRITLEGLGYKNFKIKTGDGSLGWIEHAPYDGIIVTAGAPGVPESLLGQLKDGGRLIIPIGSYFKQVLTMVEKKNNLLTTTEVCGCVFVPLLGKEGWTNDKMDM
ncbi:MAG: protein-L-isoaspartate(D-aspartate) O-methyltransferase [Candidatus Omnitrophota bacterium]|jgi:protein-L-isoaspartate(D-aspartate) O-methyltransferase